MKIYVGKLDPTDCYGDVVTMVVVQASTVGKKDSLIREFNADRSIRSSGGAPIDLDGDEMSWYVVGTALESEVEEKILHYTVAF